MPRYVKQAGFLWTTLQFCQFIVTYFLAACYLFLNRLLLTVQYIVNFVTKCYCCYLVFLLFVCSVLHFLVFCYCCLLLYYYCCLFSVTYSLMFCYFSLFIVTHACILLILSVNCYIILSNLLILSLLQLHRVFFFCYMSCSL